MSAVAMSRVPAQSAGQRTKPRAEAKILFQQFFKSVGPRTYAAQVKQAGNGNHFVVLTEARRKEGQPDPSKTRLFVFSEDFVEFFKLIQATAQFIKSTPLSDEVRARQKRYWAGRSKATADKCLEESRTAGRAARRPSAGARSC